jgi:hypothetical protein
MANTYITKVCTLVTDAHCPARTSARQDGVRPNKAKPKLLALDTSNDAAVVKTFTSQPEQAPILAGRQVAKHISSLVKVASGSTRPLLADNEPSISLARGSRRKPVDDKLICKKSRGSAGNVAERPLIHEMKQKLQMAAEAKDYTTCVQIEEQISAMEQSNPTESNKAGSRDVCCETKDSEEALNMRMAVVQGLLDQASHSRQWQKCVSFQQELSELALHINTLRRESTVSGKRNDLQATLAAAQLSKDWLECARISEEMKNLDDDMCCPESDVAQISSGLDDDSTVRRIASLQQELKAAAESKMFVQCQTIQQEIDSLRRDSEFPMLRARVPSDHGMSEHAPSVQQKLLDLEDAQLRASAANEFEECDRIESEISDLKRLSDSISVASDLEDIRQKISSLEVQQAAAANAKDWKKCLQI